jgi:pilus assembly protein TadC
MLAPRTRLYMKYISLHTIKEPTMISSAFRALNAGLTAVASLILKLFVIVVCTIVLVSLAVGTIPVLIQQYM